MINFYLYFSEYPSVTSMSRVQDQPQSWIEAFVEKYVNHFDDLPIHILTTVLDDLHQIEGNYEPIKPTGCWNISTTKPSSEIALNHLPKNEKCRLTTKKKWTVDVKDIPEHLSISPLEGDGETKFHVSLTETARAGSYDVSFDLDLESGKKSFTLCIKYKPEYRIIYTKAIASSLGNTNEKNILLLMENLLMQLGYTKKEFELIFKRDWGNCNRKHILELLYSYCCCTADLEKFCQKVDEKKTNGETFANFEVKRIFDEMTRQIDCENFTMVYDSVDRIIGRTCKYTESRPVNFGPEYIASIVKRQLCDIFFNFKNDKPLPKKTIPQKDSEENIAAILVPLAVCITKLGYDVDYLLADNRVQIKQQLQSEFVKYIRKPNIKVRECKDYEKGVKPDGTPKQKSKRRVTETRFLLTYNPHSEKVETIAKRYPGRAFVLIDDAPSVTDVSQSLQPEICTGEQDWLDKIRLASTSNVNVFVCVQDPNAHQWKKIEKKKNIQIIGADGVCAGKDPLLIVTYPITNPIPKFRSNRHQMVLNSDTLNENCKELLNHFKFFKRFIGTGNMSLNQLMLDKIKFMSNPNNAVESQEFLQSLQDTLKLKEKEMAAVRFAGFFFNSHLAFIRHIGKPETIEDLEIMLKDIFSNRSEAEAKTNNASTQDTSEGRLSKIRFETLILADLEDLVEKTKEVITADMNQKHIYITSDVLHCETRKGELLSCYKYHAVVKFKVQHYLLTHFEHMPPFFDIITYSRINLAVSRDKKKKLFEDPLQSVAVSLEEPKRITKIHWCNDHYDPEEWGREVESKGLRKAITRCLNNTHLSTELFVVTEPVTSEAWTKVYQNVVRSHGEPRQSGAKFTNKNNISSFKEILTYSEFMAAIGGQQNDVDSTDAEILSVKYDKQLEKTYEDWVCVSQLASYSNSGNVTDIDHYVACLKVDGAWHVFNYQQRVEKDLQVFEEQYEPTQHLWIYERKGSLSTPKSSGSQASNLNSAPNDKKQTSIATTSKGKGNKANDPVSQALDNRPRYIPLLENPSNYCYANTVVQVLICMWKDILISPAPKDNLMTELSKLVNTQEGGSVRGLFNSCKVDGFSLEIQNSASEYLLGLLSQCETDEQRNSLMTSWEVQKVCTDCGKSTKQKDDAGLIVHLTCTNKVYTSLAELLTRSEELEQTCDRCAEHDPTQPQRIHSITEIHTVTNSITHLILDLSLFDNSGRLNNRIIPFEENLSGAVWTPIAAIHHSGLSLNAGHYTAYIHDGDKWLFCDDKGTPNKIETCGGLPNGLEGISVLVLKRQTQE